jgi:TNF receptor-associated protein 1
MLLDIVARSLYSEKEIFIRELVSNASDALEKLRYLQLTNTPGLKFDNPLEIRINTDKINRTFSISDTGIGMTREELIENLGTIAKSGSKAFLKELQDKGNASMDSIIGQFGVGFYSSFMVANKVDVYTKSYKPDSKGYHWFSDGTGFYEINESNEIECGTKIVLHLKTGDASEFADDTVVKGIVQKYSNFINCGIYLNEERVNKVQALWTMEPKEVTEKMHESFYQFIAHDQHDKPRFWMHYKTDAPVNIRCLLYVPYSAPTPFQFAQDGDQGVALYSRRVLIQSHSKDILPRWLRFLKGVVDSEDIPLNLSRELLQQTAVINKIRTVLTARCVKFFRDQMKRDMEEYKLFYSKYSTFFKEGILRSTDVTEKEDIAKTLLFESSNQRAGVSVSLADYCSRMQAGQRDIYYLCAPSRELAESSPYYESMKRKNAEVLFCYDPYDEITLIQLNQYDRKNLTSVEKGLQQDAKTDTDTTPAAEGELSDSESKQLMSWIQENLGTNKVHEIKITRKLETHPCLISVPEMSQARYFLQTQSTQLNLTEDQKYMMLKPTLEINPNHSIIKEINALRKSEPELALDVARLIYDNAMITAGLIDSARSMVGRLNALLPKLLISRSATKNVDAQPEPVAKEPSLTEEGNEPESVFKESKPVSKESESEPKKT